MRSPTAPGARSLDIALPRLAVRAPCLRGGRRSARLRPMALISYARRLSDLADRDPDRPAVTCGGRRLTRGELERQANRFARDLAARGVGTGDFVTVALPNSIDWFVAYVACWKLGAVPQPVSAKLPARELSEIVALAGSKVVVGAESGSLSGTTCLPVGYRPPLRARRRPAAGRGVAGLEGADVRRLHRPPQADRGRRALAHRHRRRAVARAARSTAVSSCPDRCTTTGRR